MVAIDFPDAPTTGQVFDKWTWNGTVWELTVGTIPGAWQTVFGLNGWNNFDGTGAIKQLGYRKNGDNVELRGLGANGTIGQPAFQLPVGFRPPGNLYFAQVSNNIFGVLIVESTGNVRPAVGNAASFGFNCTFSVTP